MIVREAKSDDIGEIIRILKDEKLPFSDIDDTKFMVAEDMGIEGCVGLEKHGKYFLLRSLAVRQDCRNQGVGKRLIGSLKINGRVFILTTTARDYFLKFGFKEIERADVPEEIKDTTQFKTTCPKSATIMFCDLCQT